MLVADQRRSAMILLVLMFVGMVLETLGIGLVIPAIAMMTKSDLFVSYPMAESILAALGYPNHKQLLVGGLLILVFVYILKTLFLGYLAWRQSRFAHNLQAGLSYRLFVGYLQQPYSFHLQRNSAQLIRNIINSINGITNVVQQGLILVSEGLVLIGFSILLLWVEPLGALVVVLTLGGAAWGFHRVTRRRVGLWGKASQYHEGLRIQHLQQGLGGAKDVKLMGREAEFLAQYRIHNSSSADVSERRSTLQALPRLFLELLAVTGLVVLVIIMLIQGKAVESILPTLGLFAAAAFRLMPSINRVMGAVQNVRFSTTVIDTVHNELQLIDGAIENQPGRLLSFKEALTLENIEFRYPFAEMSSLQGVSFSVPRGISLGIIGGSGAGKSTLVDIILGLLTPDQGRVLIDGIDIQENIRGWQDQIGYVPQSIFLTDDTLRRNIAFGLPEDTINDAAVTRAIHSAQLEQFVADLPLGVDTLVGERGVRLSGGQRQRIGIARALYHAPSVLVLDEATSALDGDTEQAVMQAIDNLSGELTIVIIAHRISTLKNCTQIIELKDGRIHRIGTFQSIVAQAT